MKDNQFFLFLILAIFLTLTSFYVFKNFAKLQNSSQQLISSLFNQPSFPHDCQQLSQQLSQLVRQNNSCQSDSDCQTVPITQVNNCSFYIVNHDIDLEDFFLLKEAGNFFVANCHSNIDYCPRPMLANEVKCQNSICVSDNNLDIEEIINNAQPADSQNLSAEQIWAINLSAVITQENQAKHSVLDFSTKHPLEKQSYIEGLKEWWDVYDRQSLITNLDWVANQGHSAEFDYLAMLILGNPNLTVSQILEKKPELRVTETDLDYVKEHLDQVKGKSLYAWDFGRFIWLCRAGVVAGYLSEDEALALIKAAGDFIKYRYSSMAEFGEHFKLGRVYWAKNIRQIKDYQTQATLESLLSPGGVWAETIWPQ